MSQNTTIDRLNRISAEYKISPTPAITEALADDEFERLVGNIENKIVVTAASKVVARYKDVLCRKRRQMVFPDDYGREIRASWDNELEYFTRNVLIPELTVEISKHFLVVKAENLVGNADDRHTIDYWAKHTDPIVNYYLRAEPEQETDFDEFMSGHEYEHYVAELIRKHGWKAQVTPGSGDHGADIIAEKGRLRVAVQCKLYSSPVGNKSVQEAFSAQGFYDCQKSCVVTNSTYTNAARKAAWKLGVSLLHHEQVGEYLKGLK